ncbi:MAG: glycoside hydrolase family 30 beta sandwich domain-containing protein [Chitinophagaceae bacterium]
MIRNACRIVLFIAITFGIAMGCGKKGGGSTITPPNPPEPPVTPPVTGSSDVAFWLTTGDQAKLLQKQTVVLSFGTTSNAYPNITVDSTEQFQSIDGFGYTLTGGSADMINGLSSTVKDALIKELFGTDSTSIGVSYLRISIGASDLNSSVFSYDDVPSGQTDVNLDQFNLGPDTVNVIPVLKQVLTVNPAIKILGSPWSAPVWMKDNTNSVGGSLKTEYYPVYAKYFVKYIQAMKARGITIDAITVQNEPLHGGNNPSMVMTAVQQTDFVKNHLGPAFQAAALTTKIIIWDHNCDRPDYPMQVLSDADAKKYINGSAFHLYGGDISALSQVHTLYPDKALYFTEQYTASTSTFSGDLQWHVKNVIIGSVRNWSRNALEWNLANNASFGPHTNGGCTTCKGALTIGAGVTRNVGYYIVAHASKFVPAGSIRIASNVNGSLYNAAFLTPAGKKVLIVVNDSSTPQQFNIQFKNKWVTSSLDGGAVGTYVW